MIVVLVIDMLNDFFRDGPLAELRPTLVDNVNLLTSHARTFGFPVIWVRQEFSPDLSDAFLEMRNRNIRITVAGSPGCEVLVELERMDHDVEIIKKRYSAFYQTELDEVLSDLGAETLVICGINTHACVRMTAIDAYQRDMNVVIVSDCVASYDSTHHDITLNYLGKGIANIATLDRFTAGDF